MRVVECDCGELVQAANDDDLAKRMRDHVEGEHPDRETSDEEIRELISSRAYDATDS